MRSRSLRASLEGIRKAKEAFNRTELTQEQLAAEVGLKTRYSIGKFFKCDSVERQIFREICFRLELDWEEIAEPEPASIDALVQNIREKVYFSIQKRCGTMRVLDMSQPISLIDIYTHVHILEKIPRSRYLEIADLLQGCTPENFDRLGLGKVSEKRVPGLEAVERYPKLMVLGKPGSGKTTFLKYLTTQCNEGEYQAHLVPIFVTLKDFAEAQGCPSLLEYITQLCSNCCVSDAQVAEVLKHGRAMVLLDGLDEIREADNSRLLKQICDFSDQFHSNRFVMTCRIAAGEYTFEKFSEVEIADFDGQQIATFAHKWFQRQDPVKADRFMQKLGENQPIRELASNPLLLTLLCLVFEETADFPSNRSELYNEGLDVLLKKWDAKRNIERNQVYKKLSLQRKEDLLSQIALTTFDRGNYFFKQKELEQHIADYIRNLPDVQTDPEALQLDCEAVLKSIEAQHGLLVERARGIYSFSHLTFQEYFTAREIVADANRQALQKFITHLTEPRWHDVFLLVAGMLRNADDLISLMKQQVDALIGSDEKLQQVLTWCHQKSLSIEVSYKPVAVRAFYFALSLSLDVARNPASVFFLGRAFVPAVVPSIARDRALEIDRTLTRTLTFAHGCDRAFAHAYAFALYVFYACEHALVLVLEPELKRSLQQLQEQLPDPNEEEERLTQWWQANGQAWAEQLRAVMIKYRNIGYNWQFNNQQQEALAQYNSANQLLVDCLNSDCYVSREVRQEIEDTLLLPIAEIEKRKHG
ncbi:MAG TPA: NACHT domain-containing NTPase [Coleofasciculaceae cyanobacterium]